MPEQFYGFSMSDEIWRLFRVILKAMDFEYEVSDCDDHIHVEVKCTEGYRLALQATLDTMIANRAEVK